MTRRILVAALLGAGLTGAARADVLWDQSAIDLNATISFANAVATGFNGYTIFGMSDVTVPAGGWNINSVTTYYSELSWFPGDVSNAVLNVFPKTGALPVSTNDPRSSPTGSGLTVPVTLNESSVGGNGVAEYTASGLNMTLAPGDYWIGLTPIGPGGFFGPDLQWVSSSHYGANQVYRSYPGGNWADEAVDSGVASADGCIKIQGTVPAPASLGLLGLGGLVTLRRRR